MSVDEENQRRALVTPQFALLLVATAVFGISFSTYFLLPKFLALELGADAVTIGGLSAASMLASVFTMPFIGVQIDRHGRKFFGLLGAVTFAVSCAGYLVIESVSPLLWLLRLLQGFAFTLFYVSISTLATDMAPPARLGQAIGLFGAVMISTNALGPALAELLAEAFSWRTVFAGTVGAALLAAALSFAIAEPRVKRDRDHATSMWQVLQRPGLRRVLLVAILLGWSMGALYTFYQPWALSLGYEQVSSYLIAFAVAAMFVRLGLGGLADRVGRLRIASIAALLYVAAPISIIWLDMLGLFFTGAVLGVAHGLFFPALNAVALDCAFAAERGKAMAAYHGSFNIGFAAGSYLLGYVAIASGYPVVFWIAGAICCVGFVVLVTTPRFTLEKLARD